MPHASTRAPFIRLSFVVNGIEGGSNRGMCTHGGGGGGGVGGGFFLIRRRRWWWCGSETRNAQRRVQGGLKLSCGCVERKEYRRATLPRRFTSLYTYFKEKGFACIVTSRVVNILTLGFTIFFSGFLLLYVDWTYLRTACAENGSACDILRDATYASPLRHRGALTNLGGVPFVHARSLHTVHMSLDANFGFHTRRGV